MGSFMRRACERDGEGGRVRIGKSALGPEGYGGGGGGGPSVCRINIIKGNSRSAATRDGAHAPGRSVLRRRTRRPTSPPARTPARRRGFAFYYVRITYIHVYARVYTRDARTSFTSPPPPPPLPPPPPGRSRTIAASVRATVDAVAVVSTTASLPITRTGG